MATPANLPPLQTAGGPSPVQPAYGPAALAPANSLPMQPPVGPSPVQPAYGFAAPPSAMSLPVQPAVRPSPYVYGSSQPIQQVPYPVVMPIQMPSIKSVVSSQNDVETSAK